MNSSVAMRVLAGSLAAQHAQHSAWRTSRLVAAATANLARCGAGAPLYGLDLIELLSNIAHPCSAALNTDGVLATDFVWEGPSAAARGVWEGEAAAVRLIGTKPLIHEVLQTQTTPLADGQGSGGEGGGSSVVEIGTSTAVPAVAAASSGSVCVSQHRPRGLKPCQRPLFLSSLVNGLSCTYTSRADSMTELLTTFKFYVPKVLGDAMLNCMSMHLDGA